MIKKLIKESVKDIQNLFICAKFNLQKDRYIGKHSCVRMANIDHNVRIGNYCNITAGTIGQYTYLGEQVSLPQVKIGKFCSIASYVKLAAGNHPVHYVSTSPVTYSNACGLGEIFTDQMLYTDEFTYTDDSKRFLCEIGNDVWIATNVTIVCGQKAVHIGDGAVIAAGSVVTKDIPPYEVWAGVPAKCIRKRFDEDTIKFLQDLKWWQKDCRWIKEHIDLFASPEKMKQAFNVKINTKLEKGISGDADPQSFAKGS